MKLDDNSLKTMEVDEFFNEWIIRSPVKDITEKDKELLCGVTLIEEYRSASHTHGGKSSSSKYIYMPVIFLSLDPVDRLNTLYSFRDKYRFEELEPYLQEFVGVGGQPKTIQALLLKYTRLIDDRYIL